MFLHRRLNNLSSICHNRSFLCTKTICTQFCVQMYSILRHPSLMPGSGDGSGCIRHTQLEHNAPMHTDCLHECQLHTGVDLKTDSPGTEPTAKSSIWGRKTNSWSSEQLYFFFLVFWPRCVACGILVP